jgi:phospholipid/cholesterol/gamma-HCH transport system ATP-binding protein
MNDRPDQSDSQSAKDPGHAPDSHQSDASAEIPDEAQLSAVTGERSNPSNSNLNSESEHQDKPEPIDESVLDRSVSKPVKADAPKDSIIKLIDVSKSFGSHHVLNNITLELGRGQVTVIVGPSGVGKSVILKHISGLIKPDAGQVWFEDKRVDQFKESQLVQVRKKIGYLFQMGALFDSMNVAENICFPLVEHAQMSAAERRARCAHVLKMVGLPDIEHKMPAELSGGQQKRVALARAIVLEPEVVLYDEPTTGLDPIRADLINELILSLDQRLGITSVVVTHDMDSAYRIADRMVMIHDGRIVADGNSDDFEQSNEQIVRRFVRGEADQDDLDRIRSGFEFSHDH